MTDKQRQALNRIRSRYPVIRAMPVTWDRVRRLVRDGKEKEAASTARAAVNSHPHTIARNTTARAQRKARVKYLEDQLAMIKEIRGLLTLLSTHIEKWLVGAAGDDGKIPLWKLAQILDKIKRANRETFAAVLVLLRRGVKRAIKAGMDSNMASAQAGLDKRKAIEEGEKKATIIKTSDVYKRIFDAVATRRLKQGLFKNRTARNDVQVGKSLSQQVWDLRDAHLRTMRDTVSSGIANGRAPTAIATDIKRHTVMGGAKRGIATWPTGRGVYRTAYKNALRLARTETNSAYHEADIAYATEKGFKKMWHVSVGLRPPCASCDVLDGRIFDPEDVPALPHPNCSCYLTTIIPGVS